MSFTSLALTALILALLAASLREAGVKGSGYVLLLTGVLLTIPLFERLMHLLDFFRSFTVASSASAHVAVMLKVMGIGYVTHFAAEACRESGTATLARRVELFGKLEILLVCLPYLEELFAYATAALS